MECSFKSECNSDQESKQFDLLCSNCHICLQELVTEDYYDVGAQVYAEYDDGQGYWDTIKERSWEGKDSKFKVRILNERFHYYYDAIHTYLISIY